MNNFNGLPGRALELAGTLGDNLRNALPPAGKWLETGAKLGALKTGASVAGKFARRNPALLVAAAAGAGLLWYAVHRRKRQAEEAARQGEPIEGSSRRIDARKANGSERSRRKPASRPTRGTRDGTASGIHLAE